MIAAQLLAYYFTELKDDQVKKVRLGSGEVAAPRPAAGMPRNGALGKLLARAPGLAGLCLGNGLRRLPGRLGGRRSSRKNRPAAVSLNGDVGVRAAMRNAAVMVPSLPAQGGTCRADRPRGTEDSGPKVASLCAESVYGDGVACRYSPRQVAVPPNDNLSDAERERNSAAPRSVARHVPQIFGHLLRLVMNSWY